MMFSGSSLVAGTPSLVAAKSLPHVSNTTLPPQLILLSEMDARNSLEEGKNTAFAALCDLLTPSRAIQVLHCNAQL